MIEQHDDITNKYDEANLAAAVELTLKQLDDVNANAKAVEALSPRQAKMIKKNKWLKSKCKIIKNLIVLGFAWMFLFTVSIFWRIHEKPTKSAFIDVYTVGINSQPKKKVIQGFEFWKKSQTKLLFMEP